LGFSRERAQQLEIRAKGKLRNELVQLMMELRPEQRLRVAAAAQSQSTMVSDDAQPGGEFMLVLAVDSPRAREIQDRPF